MLLAVILIKVMFIITPSSNFDESFVIMKAKVYEIKEGKYSLSIYKDRCYINERFGIWN